MLNGLSVMLAYMPDLSEFDNLQLMTVAEVSTVLRLSRMTVYRLIRSGELQSVRVGRSYRVPAASVRSLLDASPAAGASPE